MMNDLRQTNHMTTLVEMLLSKPKCSDIKKEAPPRVRIPLSGEFAGQYLTRREAQCIFHALDDLTIEETAHAMCLSPRTIEFYLKRIRHKLNCQRKKELVHKLRRTDFEANFKKHQVLYH